MRKRRHIWMLLVVSILALPAKRAARRKPEAAGGSGNGLRYAKTGRND
jgi:hypothetical protein